MTKVADGKATKIIIPSDLQNIATLGVTLNETLHGTKKLPPKKIDVMSNQTNSEVKFKSKCPFD